MSDAEVLFARDPSWPPEVPAPVRMSEIVPKWWRELPEFTGDRGPGYPERTVKGCRPIMDGLLAGWALTMPQTVHFRADVPDENGEGEVRWSWPQTLKVEPIAQHAVEQLGKFPFAAPYIKINMAWGIQTPPGWSLLFQPLWIHDDPLPFRPLPAIVDTDMYNATVNLPCAWVTRPFNGVIDAGTPLVQVIPIRRSEWSAKIGDWEEDGFGATQRKTALYDRFYKKHVWVRKLWGRPEERREARCPVTHR